MSMVNPKLIKTFICKGHVSELTKCLSASQENLSRHMDPSYHMYQGSVCRGWLFLVPAFRPMK